VRPSYNNTIKRFFTNRVRLNVVTALEKFEDAVEYEGSIFNTVKIVNRTLVSKAKKLEILKFSTTDNLIFKYSHINGKKSYINVEKKWCSCSIMTDKILELNCN
jgi:hypothetical protein